MAIDSTSLHDTVLQDCLRVIQETRSLCQRIVEQAVTRLSNPATSPDEFFLLQRQRAQKQLFSSLAQLKSLHRNAYMFLRQTKQSTAEARQEQDRLHLQLQ